MRKNASVQDDPRYSCELLHMAWISCVKYTAMARLAGSSDRVGKSETSGKRRSTGLSSALCGRWAGRVLRMQTISFARTDEGRAWKAYMPSVLVGATWGDRHADQSGHH